jgi:hypothetical protein
MSFLNHKAAMQYFKHFSGHASARGWRRDLPCKAAIPVLTEAAESFENDSMPVRRGDCTLLRSRRVAACSLAVDSANSCRAESFATSLANAALSS